MSELRETPATSVVDTTIGADAAVPSLGAAAARSEPETDIVEVVAEEVKAEEAVTEPEAKTVEWRGLTFTLPATLPATVGLDMADVEEAVQAVAPIRNMIRSFIGRDQFAQVYAKIEEDHDGIESLGDTLSELMNACWEKYGTNLGESEASTES